MSQDSASLIQAFTLQAAACEGFGSPVSARILRAVAAVLDRPGVFADLVADWLGARARLLLEEAVPLRLLGGLHYLELSGLEPGLEAIYATGADGEAAAVAAALAPAAERRRGVLAEFMASPPQTNEVRRSICLVGGFLTVAAATGLPLRCLEIGGSAGLNQNWDRYRYAFGDGLGWGPADSSVVIDTEWEGPAPPLPIAAKPVVVTERRSCDQAPVDVADPDQALRLQAYVWADQADRLARLRGAIAIAQAHPPLLDRADAADWVEARFAPQAGAATVLFHSVVWNYLPEGVRQRIGAAVEAAGAAATADQPVAWLRMEPVPDDLASPMALRLTLWPGGDDRLLAQVHPHGARVVWLDVRGEVMGN